MKLNSVRMVSILCVLVGLSACKIRPPVTSDYDTQFNYSQLKSYEWVQPVDDKKVSTLENRRQINAIETILNRKGFAKAGQNEKADFLLRTHSVTDKKVDVDLFYRTWGYHPFGFHHPIGWPHNMNTTVMREYEVGTLVLDIVDPIKKEVIWRGSVSRKLGIYNNRSPEERTTLALSNAEYMLESFPPGKRANP